jgi:hypothetical protein
VCFPCVYLVSCTVPGGMHYLAVYSSAIGTVVDHGLPGCDAMWSCRWLPMFLWNVGNHLQCHVTSQSVRPWLPSRMLPVQICYSAWLGYVLDASINLLCGYVCLITQMPSLVSEEYWKLWDQWHHNPEDHDWYLCHENLNSHIGNVLVGTGI